MGIRHQCWVLCTVIAMARALPAPQSDASVTHRPYQFGYKVPSNQHRQESKDANGIIMGEFGFLTGDGTYHVAKYETDEFGNYRLISSKSIYRYNPEAPVYTPNPTTSSRAAKSFGSSAEALKERRFNSIEPSLNQLSQKQDPATGQALKANHGIIPFGNKDNKQITQKTPFKQNTPTTYSSKTPNPAFKSHNIPTKTLDNKQITQFTSYQKENPRTYSSKTPNSALKSNHISTPTKTPSHTIVTTTPKFIVIPEKGNYFIHIPPNAQTSLGTTGNLLYVFNYATTFNGHHEMGYRDGSKEGSYFTVNRDKLRRTVRYNLSNTNEVINRVMEYDVVADEDAPTDISDKTGVLKHNEFKWH